MKKKILIACALVCAFAVLLLGAAVIGYQDWQLRGSAPSNPASGFFRVWADNTGQYLKCLTSSGAACYFDPKATTSTPGIVQPDGSTITIASGVISAANNGTVNSGTAGQPAYYAATGSAVSGMSIAFTTLTDGSPVSWNVSTKPYANATLTLNHSTSTRALNVSNLVNGGVYTVLLVQDSTGGAALTLGTGCTWKVGGGGAGTIALSTTANAIDILAWVYDGSNCYANFRTNFN